MAGKKKEEVKKNAQSQEKSKTIAKSKVKAKVTKKAVAAKGKITKDQKKDVSKKPVAPKKAVKKTVSQKKKAAVKDIAKPIRIQEEENKDVIEVKEFTKKYDHQRRLKEEVGCDLDRFIEIRHNIHQNAETAFKEYNTHQLIKDTLISFGIGVASMRVSAGTGLIVDIEGTGPENNEGISMIALRADMDALPMPENNPDLPYRTRTDAAHMCGHDGHMATLLSATQVIFNHRDKIPKGKKVRLLFQPAEEGTGGAKPMIQDGCLEGVEEVYGFHNMPNFDEGDIRVIPGPIMASSTTVKIRVIGQGGHGSVPHMLKDVITCGGAIINQLHTIKSRCVDSKENFIFSITKFDSGFTYNVFPDDATILGTIRTYKKEVLELVKNKLYHIARSTAETFDCRVEFELNDKYPPTVNHPTETEHVVRLAKKYFGDEHVKTEGLPMTAAEDFSYYLLERPGCFYMLGTKRPGENYVLHTSHYNYNDSMIGTGAYMFLRIVEDRLACKFFND